MNLSWLKASHFCYMPNCYNEVDAAKEFCAECRKEHGSTVSCFLESSRRHSAAADDIGKAIAITIPFVIVCLAIAFLFGP